MPERSSIYRALSSVLNAASARARRAGLLLFVSSTALFAAACTEDYEGGAGCPALCPQEQAPFRDTILDAVVLDATVGPFPLLGLSSQTLLASRGDTLETYLVVRYDSVRTTYFPNNGSTAANITTVDSAQLRLRIDTTGSRSASPFTIEVFDIDTTDADTSAAVIRSLFRDDRKVSELSVVSGVGADSLRIPIPDSFVESKIAAGGRVRLGLRIAEGANVQLRVQAFTSGEGDPRLMFDAATDTIYQPIVTLPRTTLPDGVDDNPLLLSRTVYPLTVKGSDPLPPGTLGVGGWPSNRAWLRFEIPRAIRDSSTVVRAELLLTQKPSPGTDRADSVTIQPFVAVTNVAITDPYVSAALAANGSLAGLDSVRLVPQDSGQRAISIVSVVRSWAALDSSITRAIVLLMDSEGATSSEVRFHDLSAPAALRPRLRITYLPRTEFALP